MHQYRTHTTRELSKINTSQQVKLSGWVHRKRDHGNLLFIDLRDHHGLIQCVFNDEHQELMNRAASINYESVITIEGRVVARSEDTINESLNTGEIEIIVTSLHIESEAAGLPIQVNSDGEFPEDTRLKYRFLDLRREKIHNNIVMRSRIIQTIRELMNEQEFLEIQTPILTASSPEGARDYLVPSRLHPGKFYALPQAPQQFKQMLMMSGFDKYFQIAPCFRDEDARADRSPGEFYQLDMEMAFVTQEDVFAAIEPVLSKVFKQYSEARVSDYPFKRIPYDEAMLKYGTDKPDLRNPLEIADVSEVFKSSEFAIFRDNVKKGKVVRALTAPGAAKYSRSFFDNMNEFARGEGAGGLGYVILSQQGEAKGPIAKFLTEEEVSTLKQNTGAGSGDVIFFVSEEANKAASVAGKVRDKLGRELELLEKDSFRFCWIIDFPYYEYNEETGRIDFSHNPFSMPQGGLEALKDAQTQEDLLQIKAYQYDIVCNGVELSSGAIRNHKPEIMYKAFEIAGYPAEEVDRQFAGMINAFKYGAPPHGGIAPGIDRIIMLITEEPNIREVIAFPMNQGAEDPMMQAPANISQEQLNELGITHTPKVKQFLNKQTNKTNNSNNKSKQN
jgi:aspartyl-tRNA synthetase